MKKSSEKNDLDIAPLRTLDDFLLKSARFQIPNYSDLEKWGNRVTSNLLYYQSNYFLLALSIFTIIGIIHPIKMACGVLTTAVIFMLFVYITNEKVAAAHFKKKHPLISLALIFAGGYFIAYMLKSLLVFLLGIMLPFAAILVHASLRLRNTKNKIENTVEFLGHKHTPMGIFLEEMGVENKIF